MKIAVAGTGYVGLSLATLLSPKYEVVALNRTKEKAEMINNRIKVRLMADKMRDKKRINEETLVKVRKLNNN